MTLTASERLTLAAVGMAALVGLGLLLWQRQSDPLTVSLGTPDLSEQRASGSIRHSAARANWWDDALTRARQVDINTAGAAELERLPEIGPALAQRIVAHRARHGRFGRPEELLQVSCLFVRGLATLVGIPPRRLVHDAFQVLGNAGVFRANSRERFGDDVAQNALACGGQHGRPKGKKLVQNQAE